VTSLFGIREHGALAFGRNVYRVIQERDSIGWRKLFVPLSALHARPFLGSDGRFDVDAHPLCDFDYHRPPRPDDHLVLVADAVPEGDLQDLEWLLMYGMLLSCRTHTTLEVSKLAFVWFDDIAKDELAQGARQEQFAAIGHWVFQSVEKPPEDLWFLRAASYLHSYIPPGRVRDLASQEDANGLLKQLTSQYEASGHAYLHDVAADLARLRCLLGLAAARHEAVFVCYGIE
jgi:hypothetical protein